MSKKLPADHLRAMIAAKGWGTIGVPREPETYSPDPIEVEPDTQGTVYNVDPDNLTDEQQDLIADCFRLVAACLTGPDAAEYADLLAQLMEGEE